MCTSTTRHVLDQVNCGGVRVVVTKLVAQKLTLHPHDVPSPVLSRKGVETAIFQPKETPTEMYNSKRTR